MAKKGVKIDHYFFFGGPKFENDAFELFCHVLRHVRPQCNLPVLLRRWWILRNNL